MPSPALPLNEEERAALAQARASLAVEGYPTTDEQAAVAVVFIQLNKLVENGGAGGSLVEALAAWDAATRP